MKQDRYACSIVSLAVSSRSHKFSIQAESDTANPPIIVADDTAITAF
jgi:hypothetical protein